MMCHVVSLTWPLCIVYDYGLSSMCHNPSFGLTTKARACKVAGQEGSPEVTSHAFESVGECEGRNSHALK